MGKLNQREIEICYQDLDLIEVRFKKLVSATDPENPLYSFSVMCEFEDNFEAEKFARWKANEYAIPVTKFYSYTYSKNQAASLIG